MDVFYPKNHFLTIIIFIAACLNSNLAFFNNLTFDLKENAEKINRHLFLNSSSNIG